MRDWQRHRGMRPAAKFTASAVAIGAPLVTYAANPGFSWPLLISIIGGSMALVVVCRLPTVRSGNPSTEATDAKNLRTAT